MPRIGLRPGSWTGHPARPRWRRPRRILLPTLALALCTPLLASPHCPGEGGPSTLEQYHPGAAEPWQTPSFFWDLCRDQLCEKTPCPGTFDAFVLDVPEDPARARDRFLFLEETADPARCRLTPAFDPGRVYRVGGRYAYGRGAGRSDRRSPLGDAPVGHVRKYVRGRCAVESAALKGLRDQVTRRLKQQMERHWAIVAAEVKRKDQRVLLGTDRCGDPASPHRDFVHLSYRFRIWPLSAGTWSFWLDLWWRFVAHPRDRYLVTREGRIEATLPCDHGAPGEHARCARLVAGSRCGLRDRCERPHALDVSDFGASVRTESHCHQAAFCDTYLARFRRRWEAVARDPYPEVFAPLLQELQSELWATAPAWLGGCRTDEECRIVHEPLGYEGRCAPDPEGDGEGRCEVRPVNVYDVNLYPDRAELVLARRPGDAGYGLSVLLGRCQPAKLGFTDPTDLWASSHWED